MGFEWFGEFGARLMAMGLFRRILLHFWISAGVSVSLWGALFQCDQFWKMCLASQDEERQRPLCDTIALVKRCISVGMILKTATHTHLRTGLFINSLAHSVSPAHFHTHKLLYSLARLRQGGGPQREQGNQGSKGTRGGKGQYRGTREQGEGRGSTGEEGNKGTRETRSYLLTYLFIYFIYTQIFTKMIWALFFTIPA